MKHFILLYLFFLGAFSDFSQEYLIKAFVFTVLSFGVYRVFFPSSGNVYNVKLSFKFISYLIWLLKEIFVSSVGMIKIIFFSKVEDIKPVIAFIDAKSKSSKLNTIYSNSVTLTPGTITMQMKSGRLKVHAISGDHYHGLMTGDMYKKITGSQR